MSGLELEVVAALRGGFSPESGVRRLASSSPRGMGRNSRSRSSTPDP